MARGQKMGRPPKLTPHKKLEAIKRRDTGNETLADIGLRYNASPARISRLKERETVIPGSTLPREPRSRQEVTVSSLDRN